jgi:hypothetical protein
MQRLRKGLVLVAMLATLSLATASARDAHADDQFLAALSKIATREIRKQLRDKPIHFAQAQLDGTVHAIEPDTRLEAEVKDFELGNDLLTSTVTASGRFKVDGKLNQTVEVSAVVDVKFTVAAEARFTKENDKFFIEPKVKDIEVSLSIVEISPANLSGGAELLSGLAMAAFNKSKEKVVAEVNKKLGKRPF